MTAAELGVGGVEPIQGSVGRWGRLVGIAGLGAFLGFYVAVPSYPTADKVAVAALLVAMAMGATRDFLVKFLPFFALLMAYESFRGIADDLNSRVEYDAMIAVDEWMFGGTTPTARLQSWFWDGSPGVLEFGLYGVYLLHFVLPFGLALLLWRRRPSLYWDYTASLVIASFAGFVTFLAFPAAPPWLAVRMGHLDGIDHVTSTLWADLGLHQVPTLYDNLSPNPVAAVPSLHAAYATLLVMFVYFAFGRRWALVATAYPTLIYFGTVYLGEHYLIDEFIGSAYAIAAWFAGRRVVAWARRRRDNRAAPLADTAPTPARVDRDELVGAGR